MSIGNIGMQGGFGGEYNIRAGSSKVDRKRWPSREEDLGHDVRPQQIKPEQPDRAAPQRDRDRRTPSPEVAP